MTTTETTFDVKLRWSFWALGAVLGFLQAWTSRFDAPDNIVPYLDMGNYFFNGHHWAIINGFWSPLYALLLGFLMAVFKPSSYWEYPMVHLIVFLIFLLTMTCFDFFLRRAMQLRSDLQSEKAGSSRQDWPWIAIGYTIFLWSSLLLIRVNRETPEMLVAGFFYLSCGLLVTISTGTAKWGTFLSLGLTLGLSYLTRFVTLPVSLLILATAWPLARRKTRYVVISAVTFVAIAAPFIWALSVQTGQFTFGESAKYEYLVSVKDVPHHHWQGDSETTLTHPTRQILAKPATFEFREPLKGTYPPEYDLTYWYEGAKAHVDIGQEIRVFAANLFYEFETVFYGLNGILVATLFLALYGTSRSWVVPKNIFRYWFLILASIAAAGFSALVHYNPQNLSAPFVVLLLCLFLSTASTVDLPQFRLLSGVAVLQFAAFVGLVGLPLLLHALSMHPLHARAAEKATYQEVAEKAAEMGLKPGDEIASVSASNSGMAMWAHLARLRIIAEVYYWPDQPEGAMNDYWGADPSVQETVIQKLSATGARAIVSQETPRGPLATRWSEIGTTGYYIYWVRPADNT